MLVIESACREGMVRSNDNGMGGLECCQKDESKKISNLNIIGMKKWKCFFIIKKDYIIKD